MIYEDNLAVQEIKKHMKIEKRYAHLIIPIAILTSFAVGATLATVSIMEFSPNYVRDK